MRCSMKKTNFARMAAVVAAIAVWAAPEGASAAAGDIRSIEQVSPAAPNYSSPLQVGQKFVFKVRLMNRKANNSKPYAVDNDSPWVFKLNPSLTNDMSSVDAELFAKLYAGMERVEKYAEEIDL